MSLASLCRCVYTEHQIGRGSVNDRSRRLSSLWVGIARALSNSREEAPLPIASGNRVRVSVVSDRPGGPRRTLRLAVCIGVAAVVLSPPALLCGIDGPGLASAQEVSAKRKEPDDALVFVVVGALVGLAVHIAVTYFAAKAGARAALDERATTAREAGVTRPSRAPAASIEFSPSVGTLYTSQACPVVRVDAETEPDWTASPGMRVVAIGPPAAGLLPIQFEDGRFGSVGRACFVPD